MKCRAGGLESVCISAIARFCNKGSLFQSFLLAFPQGLVLDRSGDVSVIAKYPQGEIQV